MYILSSSEMKQAEQDAIEKRGVPSLILMENAARGAAEEIAKRKPESVIVFAGKGNNGGDGLAIGRLLMAEGISVKIIFPGDKGKATTDCKKNLDILKAYDADIEYSAENAEPEKYDITVDALIGTGLSRELSDEYKRLVDIINRGKYIFAIDCPTGVNSDTGEVCGTAVKADETITFHLPKTGLMLYPACEYAGKLNVKHIGIPYTRKYDTFVLDAPKALLPERYARSHKGSYGRALMVSGCDSMAGAALINGTAAYSSGCGLVDICSTEHVRDVIHSRLPEAITSDRSNISLEKADVITIGSGLGTGDESKKAVEYVLKNAKAPVIADADALNIISGNEELKALTSVITPHIKEMSVLTGFEIEYIKNNLIKTASEYAKKYDTVVVLKGSRSIIASPDGRVCINTTGTPAMSKGGSGDSLTGVITGLMAQGLNAFDGACLGAYINGKTAELVEKEKGAYGVMALDIAGNIGRCIMKL